MSDDWMRQESGWWTHPCYGAVCRERDGWWYLYVGYCEPPMPRRRTMRAAMALAEELWRSGTVHA